MLNLFHGGDNREANDADNRVLPPAKLKALSGNTIKTD